MISVVILINGQPIMARSATNTGRKRGGEVAYRVDDGSTVYHDPEAGAVALAAKLLATIRAAGEGFPPVRQRLSERAET